MPHGTQQLNEALIKHNAAALNKWELAKAGFKIGQGNAAGGAFTAGWVFGAASLPYFRPVATAVMLGLAAFTAVYSAHAGTLDNPALNFLNDAGKTLAFFMPLLIVGAFDLLDTEIPYQQAVIPPAFMAATAFAAGLFLLLASKLCKEKFSGFNQVVVEPLADFGGRATAWVFLLGLGFDLAGKMGPKNYGALGLSIWAALVVTKMLSEYRPSRPLSATAALFSEIWPAPALMLMGQMMDYNDPKNSANYLIPAATATALVFGANNARKMLKSPAPAVDLASLNSSVAESPSEVDDTELHWY